LSNQPPLFLHKNTKQAEIFWWKSTNYSDIPAFLINYFSLHSELYVSTAIVRSYDEGNSYCCCQCNQWL